MPCHAPGGPDELSEGEKRGIRSERIQRKKDLDKVTRLLCGLLSDLEENFPEYKLFNNELEEWWNEHKEFDKKRKK